jgi:hypothetical protein
MQKLRIILGLIVVGSLVVSGLSLLLPTPSDAEISEFYSPIATSIVLIDALLAMGSAVLFLMALNHFKPELKPAYRLMAASTWAVGLGMLILPYIEYYGLWDIEWLNLSTYLQYLIGSILMYFGVRMFYRRVGLKGWPAALAIVGVLIVVASLLHVLLPDDYQAYWTFDETTYNLFKVVTIIPIVAYAVAAYMAYRIRQRTGAEYKAAFGWLSLGLLFYVISNIGIMLIEVIGYENDYYSQRIYTLPNILGDIGILLAGYCFSAIGRPKELLAESEQSVSSVDIIVHASRMASDRTKIEEYLDEMRMVTSHLQPGTAPSAEDQQRLRAVYLNVEKFLVTSDPLRAFSQDQLRAELSRRLGLDKRGDATFWPTL